MFKNISLMKIIVAFLFILAAAALLLSHMDTGLSFITAGPVESSDGSLFQKMGVLPPPPIDGPVEFTLEDLSGKPVRMSDFKGNVVFLNFWATWCPDCRIEMPSMEKLHKRFKNKRFSMVTVNLSEPASQVKQFFKTHDLTFTGLLDMDRKISRQLGIRAIPTTLILDGSGNIMGSIIGSRNWDSRESHAFFDYLVKRIEHTVF